MAQLTEKERKVLSNGVETVNALNKQVLDYSMAQFKACQLKDEAEKELQSYYQKLSKKYNNGNPIQIDYKSGEITIEETKE